MELPMRSVVLALLALSAAACIVEDDGGATAPGRRAQPLIGGVFDTEDPGVVALLSGTSSDAFCTGTLVSPSVVLTAAHCIDMFGGTPVASVFFGADTKAVGKTIGMAEVQRHLDWDTIGSDDIGLVRISVPVDPFLAVPLNDRPLDELVGASYRHVGFGKHDPDARADGKKRTASTTITALVAPDIVQSGDAEVRVCFGDSGGPGLLTLEDDDGQLVEYVVGVHSYTSGTSCNPPNGDTRVDLHLADFVRPWIQSHDPTCGADGLCAPIGCIDDPDCEPCGRDGNCTDGCALPDPDCPTSGLGEICQADTQCESGLCVFWKDDLRYRFCTVPCVPGGAGCPDGMSCQNVAPFGDICYFDQPPSGVLGDSCDGALDCGSYVCDDGQCVYACDLSIGQGCPPEFECKADDSGAYYCRPLPDEGGGCGCRTSSPAGAWTLCLVVALAALRRRRR
jgi:MYXO-CTERM domain-containing protein